MSLLDGILSQVSGNADIQNLAAKVGITPEQAESAVMALAKSHTDPGDTVEGAAASTGLGSDVLSQIVAISAARDRLANLPRWSTVPKIRVSSASSAVLLPACFGGGGKA